MACWKVAVSEVNAECKLPHCSKAEAFKISPRQECRRIGSVSPPVSRQLSGIVPSVGGGAAARPVL